jgi:hypothetical protein
MRLSVLFLAAQVGVGVVALTPSAVAADQNACLAAVDKGQGLRDEGKLREARESFLICADRACPSAVSTQCTQWLEEASRDIPSIVFRVKDSAGKELLDASVFLDGSQTALAIQATAVQLNPGSYKAKVVLKNGQSREEAFLLRKGEHDRVVEIAFPANGAVDAPQVPVPGAGPSAPVEPEAKGFRIPAYAWVGAGVGVLGIVGTVVFASSANSDQSDLESSKCAPRCDPEKRSGIETKVTLANVSMIAGGLGLGFAVVSTILANAGSKETATPQGAPTAKRNAPHGNIVVAPTREGVVAGVFGTF